ncbi:YncE family protein [Actinacidiphila acididurans]|uniref:Ig-like domain repeat protein n=1 Tax=Actinacidiphila acididurans TaxID=2784346 RepID=A0ABS2U160_9ACTN|nr:hypothetical protein [Actinacidiphila acididurans]MBM9509320.1 hypothetical protein [Actinacidiphila acididurans]
MRFKKGAVSMAAAVLAGAAFTVLPAMPAAASTPTPSPRILLDEQNQHVYLSTEGQLPYVEVFDLDGNRVGTIDDQPSASGMALSPDGSTLYIAHAELGTISAVSTATLQQTALYQTGVDTERLAFTGGRLWFGFNLLDHSDAGIGSVDLQAQTPTVSLDPDWQWLGDAPNVLADPADPNVLVVTSAFHGGGLGVYDVSTTTAVKTDSYTDADNTYDAVVTSDGEDVVVTMAGEAKVQFFRIADLQPDRPATPVSNVAEAVAVAPDGAVAAGYWNYPYQGAVGMSVVVPGESAPRRTLAAPVNAGGLAWSSDGSRLYAASGGWSPSGTTDPVLNVIHNPEQVDTTMTLTAPAGAEVGTPFSVEGALASTQAFAAGQTVHVTRTDAADPDGTALPDAAVGADGTFSFTDTATAGGDVSYQVSYDGDRDHTSARQSASLTVTKPAKADTTLWLEFENRAKVGAKLKMDGRLTSATSIPVGATVTITRQDSTGPGAALVGTRKVAADGTFQIADVPFVAGPAVYTVTYAGDDTYNGSTVSATVQVLP